VKRGARYTVVVARQRLGTWPLSSISGPLHRARAIAEYFSYKGQATLWGFYGRLTSRPRPTARVAGLAGARPSRGVKLPGDVFYCTSPPARKSAKLSDAMGKGA